jgi:hypothetical protein
MTRACARRRWHGIVQVGFAVLSVASPALAQDRRAEASKSLDDLDHVIVFEFGAAGDWSHDEGLHPGGTFAFEVTAIERWLELEVGVTVIRDEASTEMPVGVLLKKPWRFSPQFEFMIGAGPAIIHTKGRDEGTFWGVSSVLDFMFWPRRNVGWYVEPGYELTFRDGARHHGLAVVAGLLVGR